jgi:hypothetical protein
MVSTCKQEIGKNVVLTKTEMKTYVVGLAMVID